MLGSNVIAEATRRGISVSGTFHTIQPNFDIDLDKFDIFNQEKFRGILSRYCPDVVVNCAAITNVDRCEQHPELALSVNGNAPGQLAPVCAARDIGFVYVSTDYVFDGCNYEPYVETDSPNPQQAYGVSKLRGEYAIWEADSPAIIPRVSFVWGTHGATGKLMGFPTWLRSQILNGEPTTLFTNQYITLSRAKSAAAIIDLISKQKSGIFHITSQNYTTPY